MSLNEKYLDELLKSVTTEEEGSKIQSVSDENSKEDQLIENKFDNEQNMQLMQEKKHTFSEDDLTEMLEHLEEIDASSVNKSSESLEEKPLDSENLIGETVTEEEILETEYDGEENGEASTMAESAEFMSDIDEMLKEIEESSNEVLEDSMQGLQSQEIDSDVISAENDHSPTETNVNNKDISDDTMVEETVYEDKSSEDVDVMSLLDAMDDNSDLAEIGSLLQKDENHEEIDNDDMMAMLERAAALEDEYQKEAVDNLVTSNDSESVKEEKKKKGFFSWKKKKKNRQKEEDIIDFDVLETGASEENSLVKARKKGFFDKILDIFFEEEEETLEAFVPGVGEEGASDENLAILQELDKEKSEKKNKKKKKKEKDNSKEKKEKKPKKEKVPKKPKESPKEDKPDKKISRRKIVSVILFAITVLAMVLIVVIFVPNKISMENASLAYNEQDFETAYIALQGMKLNETEKTILKKTTVILELRKKYDAYVKYDKMGMKMEALNSLFQGIIRYDKLTPYAQELNLTSELEHTYQQILSVLNENYGVSEEEARTIIAYDKVVYTKKLDSMINGTEFIDPNAPVIEPATLEDMLPEEELMMQEINNAKNSELDTEEYHSSGEDGSVTDSENSDNIDSKVLYSGSVNGSEGTVDFSEQGIEERPDDSNN